MTVRYRYFAHNRWIGDYQCDSEDFKALWRALLRSKNLNVQMAYVWEDTEGGRMWVWHRELFKAHWIECDGELPRMQRHMS